jgi:hypothetical protein
VQQQIAAGRDAAMLEKTRMDNETRLAVAELGAKVDRLTLFMEERARLGLQGADAVQAGHDRLHDIALSALGPAMRASWPALLAEGRWDPDTAFVATFLPNDQILLSIRASRSFIEENNSPDVALLQTRNSVNGTALLNYGQTFVMNGLVEREKDEVRSGVPILEDIPILQYFFNKTINLDYNRQILTLVTVRRLVDSDESIAKTKNKTGLISAHKLSSQVQEFMDLQNNVPVLDEVIHGLRNDNSLYTRLRQRDMIQDAYGSKGLLHKIIHDLKDMAYY